MILVRILLAAILAAPAIFGADAANDLILSQRNGTNTDNTKRNVAAAANGLLTFNASLVPTAITSANSSILVTNESGVAAWGTDIPAAVTIGSGYIYRAGGTDVAVADGGTGLSSGTSGGVLAFTASGTLASSGALAANALVIGGGAGVAPSTTTTGTGVLTALGVNVGSAGAFVTFNGALGTPSSGTLTNATGLPQAGTVGLTTSDSPQFAGVNIGHATDTTLTRASAGQAAVEGNNVFTATKTTATELDAAYFAADAGSTDDYAATLSPAIAAYTTGNHYRFKANTANTGAATINFNSLGAKTIVKVAGGITTALASNDIRAGQWVDLVYDGTNMQMQSTLGNSASATTGYNVQFYGRGMNPAASTTYYTGGDITATAQGRSRIYINTAGTITAARIDTYASTTNGSAESIDCNLTVNNGSNNLIASVAASATTRHFANASLSIAVAAGDYIELKWPFPAWTTAPQGWTVTGTVWVNTTP